MAWVAFDRAVKAVEQFGLDGPVDRWRAARDEVHREVCERGFDAERNAFTQYYGSKTLDASTLMIALVGFLPATDPRIVGTVEAIQRELLVDGLVLRYASEHGVDGLPPGEGVFLPCSFWLADNLDLMGRSTRASRCSSACTGLVNDVGLIAEEYDPTSKRMLGNFPQAFTHVSLVNGAYNFEHVTGPALHRADGAEAPGDWSRSQRGRGTPTRVAAPPVSSCGWSGTGRVRDCAPTCCSPVRPRSSRAPTTPGTTPSRARSRMATSGDCPPWAGVACCRSAFRPPTPLCWRSDGSLLFWVNSFDAHLWTGAALGALATGTVAALTWRLGRRAPLRARALATIAAGLLFALNPAVVGASVSLMSEALVLPIVAFVLLVIDRLVTGDGHRWEAVVLGALLAIGALTRSEAIVVLAAAVVGGYAVSRARPRAGVPWVVALAIGFGVAIAWSSVASVVAERPVVMGTNSGSLLLGANCPVTHTADGIGYWSIQCLTTPDRDLCGRDGTPIDSAGRVPRAPLRVATADRRSRRGGAQRPAGRRRRSTRSSTTPFDTAAAVPVRVLPRARSVLVAAAGHPRGVRGPEPFVGGRGPVVQHRARAAVRAAHPGGGGMPAITDRSNAAQC